MFWAVSPPIIRSSRKILLAATASGSSKQAWHTLDAVCTVLELLMDEEIARNTYSIDNNKEYYKTLPLLVVLKRVYKRCTVT
jgi:hypothetical protein